MKSISFVVCENAFERQYMIKVISEENPQLVQHEVEEAIYICCRDVENKSITKSKRELILHCLFGKLGL